MAYSCDASVYSYETAFFCLHFKHVCYLQVIASEPQSRQQTADPAAVKAFESSYQERQIMTKVRLELESLRILMQRINKREKLKRDGNRPSFMSIAFIHLEKTEDSNA